MQGFSEFLPINANEAHARGWHEVDFVLVSGDAYVDHPSFAAAIIGRVLEAEGYRVGLLAQPAFNGPQAFTEYGRPRYGFLVSGGNVDSMVAHYTVAKRRRTVDEYTPGGKPGKRPDRNVEVYTRLAKQAYPDVPVVAGGLEASLRRFAHYDYWEDRVLPSVAETSGADLILFGMGERSIREVARILAQGGGAKELQGVAGAAYLADFYELPAKYVECASYSKVKANKEAYARACRIQLDNQDPMASLPVVQKQSTRYLVQNLPSMPLNRAELDKVYALPFTRRCHPSYEAQGGVPALEEVEFSIIHNRGCFGGCNFCAIALHQGLRVTSRSADSVVKEGELLTKQPGFKGYIHDVGGPTANFRTPSCGKQIKEGVCTGGKRCLAPSPCPHLIVGHTEYLTILRRLRALPGVKKVFVRSGIRYDYLVYDKDESFFKELVEHHISGQLKVAPEHCSPGALRAMGKPSIEVYNNFAKRFYQLTKQAGKPQYLVP
ncbi:MAG: YgiQ family radical SAM protein, partial [Oscillospiraceae bacterium]